jgi:hypothetical protein
MAPVNVSPSGVVIDWTACSAASVGNTAGMVAACVEELESAMIVAMVASMVWIHFMLMARVVVLLVAVVDKASCDMWSVLVALVVALLGTRLASYSMCDGWTHHWDLGVMSSSSKWWWRVGTDGWMTSVRFDGDKHPFEGRGLEYD